MKKRLIPLLTGTISLCLAACSPHSDRLDVFDVPPERQNFHWAVAPEGGLKRPPIPSREKRTAGAFY